MPPKAAASPSFEDALSELETIVKGLESGRTTLEESITAYTRGMELKKICEARLKDAQSRIEKITISPDGSVGTTPFETE
jgi:exodeoxyribonuclease VII small subunit